MSFFQGLRLIVKLGFCCIDISRPSYFSFFDLRFKLLVSFGKGFIIFRKVHEQFFVVTVVRTVTSHCVSWLPLLDLVVIGKMNTSIGGSLLSSSSAWLLTNLNTSLRTLQSLFEAFSRRHLMNWTMWTIVFVLWSCSLGKWILLCSAKFIYHRLLFIIVSLPSCTGLLLIVACCSLSLTHSSINLYSLNLIDSLRLVVTLSSVVFVLNDS